MHFQPQCYQRSLTYDLAFLFKIALISLSPQCHALSKLVQTIQTQNVFSRERERERKKGALENSIMAISDLETYLLIPKIDFEDNIIPFCPFQANLSNFPYPIFISLYLCLTSCFSELASFVTSL